MLLKQKIEKIIENGEAEFRSLLINKEINFAILLELCLRYKDQIKELVKDPIELKIRQKILQNKTIIAETISDRQRVCNNNISLD